MTTSSVRLYIEAGTGVLVNQDAIALDGTPHPLGRRIGVETLSAGAGPGAAHPMGRRIEARVAAVTGRPDCVIYWLDEVGTAADAA